MKRQLARSLLVLTLAGAAAPAVVGQTVPKQFPPDLHWETMDLLALNLDAPEFASSPAQRDVARVIWQSALDAFPPGGPNGKWPAFILLKVFESTTERYVFTAMSAAAAVYPKCEDATNSKDPTIPIYTICPMRVVVQDKASGRSAQQEFERFCVIFSNDPDNPKSKNYEQVAISADHRTAYFRVVQYGKPAPECNRSIRLR